MNKLLELRYLASFSAFFVAVHGWAMAEPTLDQLLATVSVAGSSACAHVWSRNIFIRAENISHCYGVRFCHTL